MMNARLKALADQASDTLYDRDGPYKRLNPEKFAELIVRACADAADMALEARCEYPGDYVVEQMGYGLIEGAAAWRNES